MKTKFTKPILYGYMVIFMIISLSSLGYYLDSINPVTTTKQIEIIDNLQAWLSDNCDHNTLIFINKASTILDEPWEGQYMTNFIGVPDDLTIDGVEKCMDDIIEKRKNEN